MFLSLWKDFGSRFDSIIESLKKQRHFVDVEAASIDIVEAKEARRKVQEEMQERQKREKESIERNERSSRIAQLQHSITWLSVDDSIQENELDRISRRRHDETCQWVAKESSLKSWITDDTKSHLLWLNGKPGAGKFASVYTQCQKLTACLREECYVLLHHTLGITNPRVEHLLLLLQQPRYRKCVYPCFEDRGTTTFKTAS
jgi:hypothetical protein